MSNLEGAGRTMSMVLSKGGRALESRLNKWAVKKGLDPDSTARRLRSFFTEGRPLKERKMQNLCKNLVTCVLYAVSSTRLRAIEILVSLIIEFPVLKGHFLANKMRQNIEELEKKVESTKTTFKTAGDLIYFNHLAELFMGILYSSVDIVDSTKGTNSKSCIGLMKCEICRTFLKLSRLAQSFQAHQQLSYRLKELRNDIQERIPEQHFLMDFKYGPPKRPIQSPQASVSFDTRDMKGERDQNLKPARFMPRSVV
ncbi:hypothetical protein SCHPADRAFT_27821 [Schizopora paradoxa]|uniref:Uncharacterized protein n=1 Tax=Schizopora paradoxa TaxID=27342 RepID=A0A0H2S6Y2_9AGAM|nr:hypothetical protein SCHPADRAFT_27821 [Schizopora paradoxa]